MKLLSSSLKKVLLWSTISVAVVLLALMLVGTFLDYQVAEVIAAKPKGFMYFAFGMTFEILGFLPAILVDACLVAALSVYSSKKHNKIIFHILTAMFLIGGVFCSIFWTLDNHNMGAKLYISLPVSFVVGTALSFPFISVFKKFTNENLKKLIYILAIGAVMAYLTNLIVGLLQAFWGRYRFYEVVNNGKEFLKWFNPLGRAEASDAYGANSFPSMHAASVCSMVVLLLAGWALNAIKRTKIIFVIVTTVMLVCVPLSRMVLGWHYLTDVTFALIVGLAMFVASVLIVDLCFGKRFKKFLNFTEPSTVA